MSANPNLDLAQPSSYEFSRANHTVHRYSTDLSDEEWSRIRPLLPPQKPPTGRPAQDHRTVIDAILWVMCTGNSWRSLPARYGKWTTASSRYHRWLQNGIWGQIVTVLWADPTARPRSRATGVLPVNSAPMQLRGIPGSVSDSLRWPQCI